MTASQLLCNPGLLIPSTSIGIVIITVVIRIIIIITIIVCDCHMTFKHKDFLWGSICDNFKVTIEKYPAM